MMLKQVFLSHYLFREKRMAELYPFTKQMSPLYNEYLKSQESSELDYLLIYRLDQAIIIRVILGKT